MAMESLIVLAGLWVWWLVSSRRRRWRVVLPVAIFCGLCLFLASPLALAAAEGGLTFALTPDRGETVDAIVLLGRGEPLREIRIDAASKLWQAHRAPRIFASGMLDAEEALARLQTEGVPQSQLSGERCSQTTEENAQFSSAFLYPQGIQKILLVTDAPHMWRSQILFQSFGFTTISHPVSLPPHWSHQRQLRTILREYVGLLDYQWHNRLHQRTRSEIAQPPVAVTDRIKEWNCQAVVKSSEL